MSVKPALLSIANLLALSSKPTDHEAISAPSVNTICASPPLPSLATNNLVAPTPTRCNNSVGLVVPIPTSCEESINKPDTPPVLRFNVLTPAPANISALVTPLLSNLTPVSAAPADSILTNASAPVPVPVFLK